MYLYSTTDIYCSVEFGHTKWQKESCKKKSKIVEIQLLDEITQDGLRKCTNKQVLSW